MLPQEPWLSLDPIMPINKQMGLVDRLVTKLDPRKSRNNVISKLTSFGMDKDQNKVPCQLSGGMAQRAAYLCATAAGGEILIADEPTKGLDDGRKHQVAQLLKTHASNKALLTITHDIDLAQSLGGEIIVMRKGVIVERGDAKNLLEHPQSTYAKELLQAHTATYTRPSIHACEQTPLIKASELGINRGGKRLFENLNFSVHSGEIVGICGESGAGKSTLADILLGLTKQTSGEVWRNSSLTRGQALKLYQDPPAAFPQTLTLGKNLEDLCKLHNLQKERVPELLEKLNLNQRLLERRPNQVSGGELQRFAMLRVLLMKPKLIIADEPTSRLDPLIGYQSMTLFLDQIRQTDSAVILISHNKAILRQVCSQIIDIKPNQTSVEPISNQELASQS